MYNLDEQIVNRLVSEGRRIGQKLKSSPMFVLIQKDPDVEAFLEAYEAFEKDVSNGHKTPQ